MTIEQIYIAGFRHDVQFTRTCVASIRRWYPHIPITLIKDEFYGAYSTRDIERNFGCDVLKTEQNRFGWGFGKLEPLFLREKKRFLVLDSDIVLVGPVLARLEKLETDFVVQREEPSPEFVGTHYFDLASLRRLDPGFDFPGFTFNTGQWVGTSGLIQRADFEPWLQPGFPPRLKWPEVFKLGEQGLLNYVLQKAARTGRITLARERFMEVGNDPPVADIDLARLDENSPYRFLIHWCGLRQSTFGGMVRGDILEHFEAAYFERLRFGALRRIGFYSRLRTMQFLRSLKERSRGQRA